MTTLAERALAALDETLVHQVEGAADAAWGRASGGAPIDESVEQFMRALDDILSLHEKMRAAALKKFGALR